MEKDSLTQLTALAHGPRMSVFRLLMRRYPDEIPAGELADILSLKPSTTSVYLSALSKAGLITQKRMGTSLLYRVDMDAARRLMGYLFLDCCRGRPELCPPLLAPLYPGETTMSDRKFNVLFICTGNSARSIFAESILKAEGGDRFEVFSAGTSPYSELNPFAVEMLKSKGHETDALYSKNISVFQGDDAPQMDFVFTVCNQAANEECPSWEGQPISAHWGMPDPVKAEGTTSEKRLAFQHAYGALRNRVLAFTALPLETLDRVSLQSAVDNIAVQSEEA